MDNAARKSRRPETVVSTPGRHLTEDINEEILLRLPAKSVLRFHAVCKAWRRIATDPRFLAAHARRRPAQAVLYKYIDATPYENRPASSDVDVALDVTPVSGGLAGRRRLVRYPVLCTSGKWTGPADAARQRVSMSAYCLMIASCDGVLLFKKDTGFYLLCNPITRQWAELPRLVDEVYHLIPDVEYAFYLHEPSGEYRLLCGCRTQSNNDQAWCVLSTGADEPRNVGAHVETGLVVPDLRTTVSPPAAIHGRLHWAPMSKGETTIMVTFDTTSETFRQMAGPPAATSLMKLFVMDGKIVVADLLGSSEEHVDLWFLEDYGAAGRWERRHQVATPWGPHVFMPALNASSLLSVAALADDQGNVMLGNHYGLVVYNVRRKTTRRLNYVATPTNNVLMSRYVFRESLVRLPRFNLPSTATDLPLIHFWH